MKREVQLLEYVCDGCGRSRFGDPEDDLPLGFHGDVFWVHGAGAAGGSWFACTERCIRKAVKRALELSQMNPDEYAEATR